MLTEIKLKYNKKSIFEEKLKIKQILPYNNRLIRSTKIMKLKY